MPLTSLRHDVDSVRIVTGYLLNDRGSIPGEGMQHYIHHNIQTASGDNKASYPLGTGNAVPEDTQCRRISHHREQSGGVRRRAKAVKHEVGWLFIS
jgi:hypothetical protein